MTPVSHNDPVWLATGLLHHARLAGASAACPGAVSTTTAGARAAAIAAARAL